MNFKTISQIDTFLVDVIALGKLNAKTLGLFPEGAFNDHARRKNIIIAEENGELLGYILFRVTQSKGVISIVHLCINNNYRNKGIARGLLNSLVEKYQSLSRAITLSCREDYKEASRFWEKYGFKAKHRKKSRSKHDHYLIKWWYDLGNADLFSSTHVSTSKVNAVLDASIIIKLRDDPCLENAEANALNADWLSDEVEYFYAPEIFNEINRDKNKIRAQDTRKFLNNFLEARFNPIDSESIFLALSDIISGDTVNDISDRKQLAESIASHKSYFITSDQKILSHSDLIFSLYTVRILRPLDFVLFIDQLRNGIDHKSNRLAGANYEYRQIKPKDIDALINLFLNTESNEPTQEFKQILAAVASNIKTSLFRIVFNEKRYRGFIAGSIEEDSIIINLIRTDRTSIADKLFQQLINDILNLATAKSINSVHIMEKYLTDREKDILETFGFNYREERWHRIVLNGQITFEKLLNDTPVIKKYWQTTQIIDKFAALNPQEKEILKFQLEKKIWPLKIVDLNIPTYIVPIKAYWASQLFDHHLASQSLFGAKPEIVWRKDNIYYRSVKPVSENSPARILWYVSSNDKGSSTRHKGIVGCSYLDEVHIAPAKSLFSSFKNYGIYEWVDIAKLTGKNSEKEIKALKFSDTEVFDKAIPLNKIGEIMKLNNRPINTFASPVEVSPNIFNALYKLGKKIK